MAVMSKPSSPDGSRAAEFFGHFISGSLHLKALGIGTRAGLVPRSLPHQHNSRTRRGMRLSCDFYVSIAFFEGRDTHSPFSQRGID
jgi:hypothetical protein